MTRRTIHFSDLTSRPILADADVVRVVVIDHPALSGDAVEFEASASEVTDIDSDALDVAVIELHPAGDEPPRRVILDAATFDKLAVDQPMEELLKSATPVRPNGRAERAPASRAASRPNYATLEHAGTPHKGKITEAEAQLVRENLDVVNARLTAAGQRTIDPADPTMRERYGFDATEVEPAGVNDAADSKAEGSTVGAVDAATPAADPAADETAASEHNTEPRTTASPQQSSAAKSAAGHRRSSGKSAPGAASA